MVLVLNAYYPSLCFSSQLCTTRLCLTLSMTAPIIIFLICRFITFACTSTHTQDVTTTHQVQSGLSFPQKQILEEGMSKNSKDKKMTKQLVQSGSDYANEKSYPLISIRQMKLGPKQCSVALNLVMGHSSIALCSTILYFPFSLAIILEAIQLALLLVVTLSSIVGGNASIIILRCGIGLIYIINLGLIFLSILGISRSHP